MTRTDIAQIRLEAQKMNDQFKAALPKHIPLDRFVRVLMTAINSNPDLQTVEKRSLWNAALKAAQDGLMPDGKHGAIVVYKDKRRGPIAQWLPMIAGIRQQVRNSGEVTTWEVHCVYEKDEFDFELGDNPHILHRPARGEDRGKVIAAYSVATLKGGDKTREVMWRDQIEAIREQSRAKDTGPWVSHYDEMCRKTVARRHAKVLPMSSDLDDLLRRDEDDHGSGVGPAVQPPATHASLSPAGGRSLNDALTALASMPDGNGAAAADHVPDFDDPDQGELLEQEKELSHGP